MNMPTITNGQILLCGDEEDFKSFNHRTNIFSKDSKIEDFYQTDFLMHWLILSLNNELHTS